MYNQQDYEFNYSNKMKVHTYTTQVGFRGKEET